MSERNHFVDIMRGTAMLLVVLGHTMTGCTVDSQQSFLFNIVWSLQMPLFIIISGYVTRYSRRLNNAADLLKYIKRRTLTYMLPWVIWSFLVRGIIFDQPQFFNLKWLLWHMDSGYWFLATIWTISMVFGISSFIANKITDQQNTKNLFLVLFFYGVGMVLLVALAHFTGLSFFAIKQTLYYMLFYISGYLFGLYQDVLLSSIFGKNLVDLCIALSLGIWLYIISRFNIYSLADSGISIAYRFITSVVGCIAVCGLFHELFSNEQKSVGKETPPIESKEPGTQSSPVYNSDTPDGKKKNGFGSVGQQMIKDTLLWAGKQSLEIYLLHGFVLNLLSDKNLPAFNSVRGLVLIGINFLITILLCKLTISLLNKNKTLKKVLMR